MAGAAAVFALTVTLVLANPPDAGALLFDAGWRNGVFGLAMVALVPLILTVQIGIGTAWARRFGYDAKSSELWFLWLCGSAWLSLIGVVLAVAGLINPWVGGAILVLGAGYAAVSGAVTDAAQRLLRWARLADVSADRSAFAAIRLGIVLALVFIGMRAATGELNDTDVVQFYWGWLNEVRHLGGVKLSPDFPLIQDFTAGRGNGTYLLAAGVAPGLVSHVVSAAYCIMFAMLLRAFILQIAADVPEPFRRLSILVAEVASLATLWMLPGAVAFGKYHLQFAAWALGFLLVCLHISSRDDNAARRERLLVLPLAFAIPIGLAQFEAFIALLVVVAVAVAPHPWLSARRLLPILLAGCVGAGISLFGNWLFLGIPDLNPFPLFERFINGSRFDLWTSRLQQHYINYVNGGVLTLNSDDGVSTLRELRTLINELRNNWLPISLGFAGVVAAVMIASVPIGWRSLRHGLFLLLGAILGYGLYRGSLYITLSDLALSPTANRAALYGVATVIYLLAIRALGRPASSSYLLGLLGYWLVCTVFILAFHSGSMERLMRHVDAIGVSLVLLAMVCVMGRLARPGLFLPSASVNASAGVPVLLAIGIAFSLRAAVPTAAVDPPRHLLASTLGLQGRAHGLTHPMAQFGRCDEIARSVPASARVLFLNAYTAMAYCNNAVLLPRAMVVTPHESDFARELATSSFADADTVERSLRRLNINYFLFLKHDFEFWASGLSAPFRPGEFERRFDLLAETPSFYVLTWRGGGKPMPGEAVTAISELRRFAIQQAGFMLQNEFIGQWRIMANLRADRPKYQFGTQLDFSAKGWSALYADHGWYAAEPHGTWSIGPYAVLTLPLARPEAGPMRLTMDLMPFQIPQLPTRTVRVKANGVDVATWNFKLGEDYHERSIDLPPGIGLDPRGVVLTFDISDSVSQYALGLNRDWRPVGFSVRSLVLEPIATN
ncbi:hypothetical protein [Tardiphaga robiniae]|uniref:Uncharacterized protein n=1 Tax=Tardiphaga robiniae TaxID=943830 RepID=A0A163XAQ6_9BRAD|nr:hypothetical protein [Tardiphaga robiniae]KZD20658.1 hypothetical protein A4A58_18160 [Tardiphaga robiniae]